jgi:PAS domain S-box-containing protein
LGLWLATNNAFSKVEIESPITFWDTYNGIASTIEDCIIFENKIYISNINGIQYLDSGTFVTVESIYNSQGWKFLNYLRDEDTVLLYGNGVGVFEFDGINNKSLIAGTNFRSISKSNFYNNIIYFGHDNGFVILSENNLKYGLSCTTKSYNYINFSKTFEYQADFISEDGFGNIWVFSDYEGIFKITPGNKINPDLLNFHPDSLDITKFDESSGIPSIVDCKIYYIDEELIVTSTKGICKFDYENQKFIPFSKFNGRYTNENFKIRFYEKDISGKIWIGYEVGQNANIDVITYQNDLFTIDSTSLCRLPDMKLTEIFFEPGNKYILISGSEGLFKIDSNYVKSGELNPKVFIRKITLNKDSIIFWGHPQSSEIEYNFDYDFNNITFAFASPFYTKENENEYSYFLEGFDNDWSEWTLKTEKEYTNLFEGTYIFKVKSKNIYENESLIKEFKFHIKPPVSRTFVAYLIYIILSVFFIIGIIKLYTRRLIHEKLKLENIVNERTKEISAKNIELQNQKEEILAQSEELEQINMELEKLSIVASETDNAIIIADRNGKFEWINNGFTRLYGYNFEEFTQKFQNVIDATTNNEFGNLFKRCLSEKKSISYESFIITKSGEKIWAQSTITPIVNSNGEISKLIIIDTDISKLKAAEMEITQKNEEITVQKEILEGQNEEITSQRDELEEKNEKIILQTDLIKGSIRYAKTIQLAILPEKEEISKYFDNFIIYRPKDIVSGDFYWFTKIDNYYFVAAVDCTGHGVPGAFMSMIGSRLLNEIVNQKHIYSTKDILNEMNISIIKTLNQVKTENKDGMDICLVKIEDLSENKRIISFTGTKLDLFYYSFTEKAISRIKGDRKTIGGVFLNHSKIVFTNKEIILNTNDIIYLLTDGFVDQNNLQRKRFGTILLMNVLEKNATKLLNLQKEELEKELDNWQNGVDQRDDITVLGLKM